MLSLEGQQLGNYDVTRRIRVGGMGAVYEGRQRTAFDRRVAIKVILGDYASDRDMRRRFAREARTIARLHHPHILPLIEFGDERGILYLVMPFIEGGTLTSYLRRSLPDLSEVAAIYQQLLDAVEYAHEEGLIHRDIKSSNVLLEIRRSGPPYIYLADFGLVRTMRQGEPSQVGKPIPLDQVPGTPHYMAPEQTRGIITPLTDIYALGVLLFQILTGNLPYNDADDIRVIQMHLHAPIPSPCDHDASLPAELAEVVQRAMAKRPDERYQSIADLRRAFLAALNGPAITIQDDEPEIEELFASPKRVPLVRAEPEPLIVPLPAPSIPAVTPAIPAAPRRLRNEASPTAIRDLQERSERRERPRITENARQQRLRITEEPTRGKRKRPLIPFLLAGVVPLLLLVLLIVPRILGISIIPANVPLLGSTGVATIYITAQSKQLQDSYLLTASPNIKAPDLVSRTIPDRLLSGSLANSNTVPTSGKKTTSGSQASGTVIFQNSTDAAITVPASMPLTTNSGIHIQTTRPVQVPANQDGGTASVKAIASDSGQQGNIPAHALDGTCCNNGISVKNSDAFSGGSDPQAQPTVAQSDLNVVEAALVPHLQQQLNQQLQKQLGANEILGGLPNYEIKVSSDQPIGAQATQVRVTVNVTAHASAYNRGTAALTAVELLSRQAEQTLGKVYQVQSAPVLTSPPKVEGGKGGILYLSVSVRGTWAYNLTVEQLSQWRQPIKGATSAAAIAYLNTQAGVAGVEVHLPFGSDHLPTSIDGIRIVLVSKT